MDEQSQTIWSAAYLICSIALSYSRVVVYGSYINTFHCQVCFSWLVVLCFRVHFGYALLQRSAKSPFTALIAQMVRWIESSGGPLILLARDLLHAWRGAGEPGNGIDYARACDVTGLLGVVPVGRGSGLVLADEPLATTWLAEVPHADGALVRWEYADRDENVKAVIESLDVIPDLITYVQFEVTGPLLA